MDNVDAKTTSSSRSRRSRDHNDNEQLLTVTEKVPVTDHLPQSTDAHEGTIEKVRIINMYTTSMI